ncbi:MAG: hypothetical protein AB3X44_07335 [Leptothrix sp. (in: b-proteobacteria)]|jgi:hypothetical protein
MRPALSRPHRPLACAVLIGLAGTLLALPTRSASVFEFDVWMRAIDQRSVTVQRHIAAQNHAAARADARELERLYALMQDYFAQDGRSQDAVQVSKDGRDLAAQIPGALERQDVESATKAALGIAQACNDCHDNYKPFK